MERFVVRKSGDNFVVFDTRQKVTVEGGPFATRKTAQKYADIDNSQHMLAKARQDELMKQIIASRKGEAQ